MRLEIVLVSAAIFACADTQVASSPPAIAAAQQGADQQHRQGAQQQSNQGTQPGGAQQSDAEKLDVLVVTRHLWHGAMKTSDSSFAQKQKAHFEKIAAKLGELPAKIAAYDYKIALAGNTSSNCIQAFITANNADPAGDLQAAFSNIDKGIVTPHGHIASLSANSSGYFVAFQNVMAALTDINYTGVMQSMPTVDGETYVQLPNGMIEYTNSDGHKARYRQRADDLVLIDYYDTDASATCNRPWLREDALLAIVIIDTQEGKLPCLNWKFCTMPDVEQALRAAGKLQDSGSNEQVKSYRLYALAAYQENSTYASKRNHDHSVPSNMRVDWYDFKNYIIDNSSDYLADYLGDADNDAHYEHVFDAIVAAMED